MEAISSRQNSIIKQVRKLLTNAKYRREQGLAVAEGVHLTDSLLQSGLLPKLLVAADTALKNPEIITIIKRVENLEANKVVVKDSLFSAVSDIGDGVLVVFDIPKFGTGKVLDADAVLLEDIQDPGNVGTILRTTAAAGIDRVYLSAGCASVWSPKVLRAGMGAQFGLDIFEAADLAKLIETSKVPVLATSLEATESIYSQDLRQSTTWLFGNEGQGISNYLEAVVNKKVIIPQLNSSVESLNVAASVAVCLYEQLRQRM